MERTLAIIKPDAVGKPWVERILAKNDEDETVEQDFIRSNDKSQVQPKAANQNANNI